MEDSASLQNVVTGISRLHISSEIPPLVELGRKQRESQLHRHVILQTGDRTMYGQFRS